MSGSDETAESPWVRNHRRRQRLHKHKRQPPPPIRVQEPLETCSPPTVAVIATTVALSEAEVLSSSPSAGLSAVGGDAADAKRTMSDCRSEIIAFSAVDRPMNLSLAVPLARAEPPRRWAKEASPKRPLLMAWGTILGDNCVRCAQGCAQCQEYKSQLNQVPANQLACVPTNELACAKCAEYKSKLDHALSDSKDMSAALDGTVCELEHVGFLEVAVKERDKIIAGLNEKMRTMCDDFATKFSQLSSDRGKFNQIVAQLRAQQRDAQLAIEGMQCTVEIMQQTIDRLRCERNQFRSERNQLTMEKFTAAQAASPTAPQAAPPTAPQATPTTAAQARPPTAAQARPPTAAQARPPTPRRVPAFRRMSGLAPVSETHDANPFIETNHVTSAAALSPHAASFVPPKA